MRSRTGTRVPSTIHSRSAASAGVRAGSSASSGRVVHGHQQHPLGQRQPPRATPSATLAAALPDRFQQSAELIHPQTGERLHPHPLGPQHPSHTREMPSSRPSATPFRPRFDRPKPWPALYTRPGGEGLSVAPQDGNGHRHTRTSKETCSSPAFLMVTRPKCSSSVGVLLLTQRTVPGLRSATWIPSLSYPVTSQSARSDA